jgi:hypothetical protein
MYHEKDAEELAASIKSLLGLDAHAVAHDVPHGKAYHVEVPMTLYEKPEVLRFISLASKVRGGLR